MIYKLLFFVLLTSFIVTPTHAKDPANIYYQATGTQIAIYLHPTTPISTFAIKLDATNLDIVDQAGTPINELVLDPKFVSSSNWIIPFQKVVRRDDKVWIEIAGATLSQTGWQPTQETLLTTFYVSKSTNPKLVFDSKLTAMTAKSDSSNVALLPTSSEILVTKKPSLFDKIVSFFRRMLE